MLWGAGGTVLRIAIQVVSQVLLARILGPEQFGLFATGLVIIFFTNLIADAGLCYGLVQRPSVTEEDIRFIFTWQMLLAGLICLVLILAAPIVARAFDDPRLVDVVRWLSLTAILTAAGSTAAALLRRDLDFKTLNIANVVSYAVAFVLVALPLALAGFGVAALLSAFLLQAAILSGMALARVRHSVRPLLRHPDARGIVGFGTTVLATNLINWVMSNIDRAIVGLTLGVTATGIYATVHNLINTPAMAAVSMLQPVFYSAGAQRQGSAAHLRYGLNAVLGGVCLFVAPVFVGIAVAADTFMLAVYGAGWAAGGPVLAPLSLAVPATLLMGMATPVLWNAGRTRREAELQVPMAVLWTLGCLAVAQLGSLALMSWAVAAMSFLRAGAIVWAALASIGMPPRDLVPVLAPGLLTSGLVALAAFIADRWLPPGIGPQARLALVVLACAVAMGLALRLVRGHLPGELKGMLAKVGERIPDGYCRLMYTRLLGA